MPEQYPKISVVTACFNQAAYIEECILSVVGQQYPNLEYIIIDGGSTDGTVDIIKKYEQHIAYWISEKDNGLYDALHRGFQKATGEIMGWINSDDFLIKRSLYSVADIFSNNQQVDWVQGHPCVADESGRIVFQRPQRSSKYSFYLKEYHDGIFIQQESTYWRSRLWEKAGMSISRDYLYAGDFELWMRFYKYAEQYTTPALIGAFRMRKDQISEKNYKLYLQECDSIIEKYAKELTTAELSVLRKMTGAGKKNVMSFLLRRLGVKNAFDKSLNKIPLAVNYDRELQRFVSIV